MHRNRKYREIFLTVYIYLSVLASVLFFFPLPFESIIVLFAREINRIIRSIVLDVEKLIRSCFPLNFFKQLHFSILYNLTTIENINEQFIFNRSKNWFFSATSSFFFARLKSKELKSVRGIRSSNEWRGTASEEETQRAMCCDLLWKEVSPPLERNIFTIFPVLPLWICQISIGAEDRGEKKTPKYFFRSANPNGSNRFFDGQTMAKFLLSCSSQPRVLPRDIIIITDAMRFRIENKRVYDIIILFLRNARKMLKQTRWIFIEFEYQVKIIRYFCLW